ncbi:hypothetical protein [Streptomyces sp. NRRL B-24484]|uniref:hypothetical protein n=1 Tax=Streptomyces sp. NRRL B-24484 TaxID=1463833 RepID=UPI0004C14A5C|nr:hypothetical protein [Streptomyces sp. NRRL B-24484]
MLDPNHLYDIADAVTAGLLVNGFTTVARTRWAGLFAGHPEGAEALRAWDNHGTKVAEIAFVEAETGDAAASTVCDKITAAAVTDLGERLFNFANGDLSAQLRLLELSNRLHTNTTTSGLAVGGNCIGSVAGNVTITINNNR